MRTLLALITITLLTACVDNGSSSWDRQTWGDPAYRPNYASMKSLEQPGIY